VIGADEAVNLRDMGFLRGPWQAESEIEPESDVQDAHEAQWPEDWAGEEEAGDIMRLTSGPVRLYASNKYNHDILPTGRVKPQTMKRLAEQLEDDEAFQSVSVENGDEYSSQVPRDGADGSEREERSGGGLARESRVSVMSGIGRAREAESYEDGGDETDIVASLSSKPNEVYKGIPMMQGVSKEDIDKWLDQASFTSSDSKACRLGAKARATDVPNLDLVGVDRPKARIEAEHRLDQAIQENDADAVEACIAEINRIDEAHGN